MELLDSRRLIGPNLLWNQAGAIIDVALSASEADRLIDTWQEQVRLILEGVDWSAQFPRVRTFTNGASLFISAPEDALYSATVLNEAAWERTVHVMQGERLPSLSSLCDQLKSRIATEQSIRLQSLQEAARTHRVTCLTDDDQVSLGMGSGSTTWPIGKLPHPDEIDWPALSDVPVVLVTGTNGKSTTVRLLASILESAGFRTGLTSTDWIKVGNRILERGDFSGPGGARTLLRDRNLDVAVLEIARGGILRRGLPVRRASAAAVLNVAEDHLGEYGINMLNELAEAKFVVSKALSAEDPLVLNGDDAGVIEQARGYPGRIIWFSMAEDNQLVNEHLQKGGTALLLSDGQLICAANEQRLGIAEITDIPVTMGGAARHNISNCLAACALAHSLKIDLDFMRTGLASFRGGHEDNPGRGNYYRFNGLHILLDFAHNVHGLSTIEATVRQIPARRRLIMLGHAGDRSDEDIRKLTRAACNLLPDHVVITEVEQYLRGRQPGEVPQIIYSELLKEGLPPAGITRVNSTMEGVRAALDWASPGDFLFLQVLSERDEISNYLADLASKDQANAR